jgi:hypothetical protein
MATVDLAIGDWWLAIAAMVDCRERHRRSDNRQYPNLQSPIAHPQ